MTINEIYDRIFYLREAIAYSRINESILNVFQRMVCNQEIAYLTNRLNDDRLEELPHYKIPKHLEVKVEHIHQRIKQTGWVKPVENIEPY